MYKTVYVHVIQSSSLYSVITLGRSFSIQAGEINFFDIGEHTGCSSGEIKIACLHAGRAWLEQKAGIVSLAFSEHGHS